MTGARRLDVRLILGIVIVLGTVAFRLSRSMREFAHEDTMPGLAVGARAPDFTLQRIEDGSPVTFAELLDRPLVINFWATWWDPRVPDTKVLIEAAKRYGDRVRFVGVVYDDTRENALQLLSELPTPYPQFMDEGGRAAAAFGLSGTPSTIFVSTDRMVRMTHGGSMRAERLDVQVENLFLVEAELRKHKQEPPSAPPASPHP